MGSYGLKSGVDMSLPCYASMSGRVSSSSPPFPICPRRRAILPARQPAFYFPLLCAPRFLRFALTSLPAVRHAPLLVPLCQAHSIKTSFFLPVRLRFLVLVLTLVPHSAARSVHAVSRRRPSCSRCNSRLCCRCAGSIQYAYAPFAYFKMLTAKIR